MDHRFPYGAVSLVDFLLISISILLLVMESDGRYLRPSDHGLAYQNSSISAKEDVPEMLSFFNGGKTASFQSSSDMPLPEARNMSSSSGNSTATWWSRHRKSSDDTGKNRLRNILLLASVICGLTGILLLVFSACVFVFRCRQQRQQKKMEAGKQRTLPPTVAASSPSTLSSVSSVVTNNNSSTK